MKKKIAIIGGAGHIGLPLAFLLAQNKHEVVCIDKNVKAFNLLNAIYGKCVDLILNSTSTHLTIYTLIDNQQKYEFKNIFEVANMMKHGDYFLYPMLQYILDKIQKLNAFDAFEKLMKLIEINNHYLTILFIAGRERTFDCKLH